MNLDDLGYIADVTARMATVPTRIYQAEEKILLCSPVPLSADPVTPYEHELLTCPDDVSYLVTEEFTLYGAITTGDLHLVVGPLCNHRQGELELQRQGVALGVDPKDLPGFVGALRSLGILPHETALLMLCSLAFALTGQHLAVDDLAVHQSVQDDITRQFAEEEFDRNSFGGTDVPQHSSRQIELAITDFIRQGKPDELKRYLGGIPSFRTGTLSSDYLRHLKNTFVTEATLYSRAAIEGGMSEEEALTLSDSYINRCETLTDADAITNLGWHMIMAYAQRVDGLRVGGSASALVLGVSNYVHGHLYQQIRTQDIADALYVSRGFLSTRFKEESGVALAEYVQIEKVEEAKRLLANTQQPLISISTYLGFCSQSHFCAVFRRHVGTTPGAWRTRKRRR